MKENWPATFAEVTRLFDQPPPGLVFEKSETVDGCHGRIAIRRHTVCQEIGWMTSDRRYPGEPRFPGLAMIGRVVRGHWGIENRLHWMLDVVFREDLARLRSGNAPANMAIVRHAALNLLSGAKPTTSFKNRRKKAGWNVNYLETLLRGTA